MLAHLDQLFEKNSVCLHLHQSLHCAISHFVSQWSWTYNLFFPQISTYFIESSFVCNSEFVSVLNRLSSAFHNVHSYDEFCAKFHVKPSTE